MARLCWTVCLAMFLVGCDDGMGPPSFRDLSVVDMPSETNDLGSGDLAGCRGVGQSCMTTDPSGSSPGNCCPLGNAIACTGGLCTTLLL